MLFVMLLAKSLQACLRWQKVVDRATKHGEVTTCAALSSA